MAPFARKHVPAHVRAPMGRPSEYRPEYCDLVIEEMGKGYSLTACAGVIGVAKQTIYRWIREHADFSDAVSRGHPSRLYKLETNLLTSRKGAQTTAAIFGLRNADPDEWKDVKHQEHSHSLKVEALTDAQLYAIAAQAEGAIDTIEGEFTRLDDTD